MRRRQRTASGAWTAEQWRAMRSPQRVHLLAALQAFGEASVADLAMLTGRTRQSIYPHLTDMARAGLIGRGARQEQGRMVTSFKFLPEQLARCVDTRTGRGIRAAADVSARALHDAGLRCHRWGKVADNRAIDLFQNPEAVTSIRVTWLDDRLRLRLNQLLRQAARVLQQGCTRRKGQRTCVLMYHFPDFTAAEARRALGQGQPSTRSR